MYCQISARSTSIHEKNYLKVFLLKSYDIAWSINIFLTSQPYSHYKEFHVLSGEQSFSTEKTYALFQVHLEYFFGHTAQKMFSADLVTFTEEIRNGKLHFFCVVTVVINNWKRIFDLAIVLKIMIFTSTVICLTFHIFKIQRKFLQSTFSSFNFSL